ncbi:MAG: tRNA (N6-threonylcarbamoyladenosine(37)-N6)-methyltransferase TrmO [Bacteroidaceae bacterium]|nr:tRNA (N6-threonylcarbamoyladenosine(37)-N6)-methyltransferase TrmO [Bacteroidaceae bacterium]
MEILPIAHIESDFDSKFGVPRQSGVVKELTARIVFAHEFRNPDAFRDLDGFSHIWLLWDFSETHKDKWKPTVRPPRLGGNKRVGVFATRSPFRPNAIGLSVVRLVSIDFACADAPVLVVEGADLMNGTPIYDVKPYLPYADCIPDAVGGFTDAIQQNQPLLEVDYADGVRERLCSLLAGKFGSDETLRKIQALGQILSNDPRPHYQHDASRVYGMTFAGIDVHFVVSGSRLTVIECSCCLPCR